MNKIHHIAGICLILLAIVGTMTLHSCKGKQRNNPEVAPESEKGAQPEKKNVPKNEKIILFFGNSLTAGYGLEEDESFPYLIQKRIDSLNLSYTVVNAGLSGETTAGGNGRIDWVLKQPVDVFVLELGGNDVLRGLDLDQTERNLRNIIEKVRNMHPDIPIVIAGMQAPPNMGDQYTSQFTAIFPRLAEDYNAGLIPFLLDGVAGDPRYNLPDGIHPNPEGQEIVADNVWEVLKDYLE